MPRRKHLPKKKNKVVPCSDANQNVRLHAENVEKRVRHERLEEERQRERIQRLILNMKNKELLAQGSPVDAEGNPWGFEPVTLAGPAAQGEGGFIVPEKLDDQTNE